MDICTYMHNVQKLFPFQSIVLPLARNERYGINEDGESEDTQHTIHGYIGSILE